MINKKYIIGMLFLIGIFFFLSFSSAYTRTVTSGAQYARIAGMGGFGSTDSLRFDKSMCEQGGQDLLIQITPFGCTPPVVRSDLLEDQDVQVYCQLGATKINPLIDIEAIDYMSFSGKHSKEISGVGYFPSQAALGVIANGELTSPVLNNLGYVVVTIKQQPNESAMPKYVEGNLTAKIRYDIKNAFGVGNVNFYLPELTDEEWNQRYTQYSFWQGRGYLRALSVDNEGAQIAIYADDSIVTSGAFSKEGRTYSKTKYSSFYLKEGEKSEELYLPGFSPCLATLNVRLQDLINPETRVKLKVGSEYVEVAKKEKFLDNKCEVKDISKDGLRQSVKIYCKDDEKPTTTTLGISPRVRLNIEGKTEEYGIGDWLFDTEDGEKSVYLAYVGSYENSEKSEDLYALLIATPEHKEKLSVSELSSASNFANSFVSSKTGAGVYDAFVTGLKGLAGRTMQFGAWSIKGDDYFFLSYKNPKTGTVAPTEKVKKKQVSLIGYGEGEDRGILSLTEESYNLYEDKSAFGTKYVIKQDDGTETGLMLRKDEVGGNFRLKLEKDTLLSNTPLEGLVMYGSFYSEENKCEEYKGCPKFVLSTGSEFSPSSKFEEFFENLVGAEIIPGQNKLTVYKALFDDASDNNLTKYYENAMKDFQTIDVSFSGEKDSENSELTYGEKALYESISLAYSLNKKKTMLDLCDKFKEKYDESALYPQVLAVCDNEYRVSSDELSSMEVSINGVIKEISFEGIYEPNFKQYGAELFVQGPNGISRTLNLEKNKIVDLVGFRESGLEQIEYVKLDSLDENSADIYISVAKESALDKGFSSNTHTLELDNPFRESNSGYTFTLKKINLEKSAKISITGNTNFEYSEADFGFKIGIEKRSFPLSPETANKKIKSLNDSISKWQKYSDNLANVVTTMKKACLATGGVLTLKNLINNLDGRSIARQKVMQGTGGWNDKCAGWVSDGEYGGSLDRCFLENSDAIDGEVEKLYEQMQIQNSEIKEMEKGTTNPEKIFGNNYVNTEEFMKKYSLNVLGGKLSSQKIQNIINYGQKKSIDFSNIGITLGYESWKEGKYTLEQLRDIELYANVLADEPDNALAKEKLYNLLNAVETNAQTYTLQKSFEEISGLEQSSSILELKGKKVQEVPIYAFETFASSSYAGYNFGADAIIFSGEYVYAAKDKTSREEYLIVYDRDGAVKRTYKIDSQAKTLSLYKEEQVGVVNSPFKLYSIVDNPFNLYFKLYDETSLKNKYNNPTLRYYEQEPNKGDPAIVPFDTKEGWYAATKSLLGIGGNIQAYDDSGVIKSFWLCNVGGNGVEEFFSSARDDICEQINFGTGQPYNQFSGLSADKASSLVVRAQQAIETAQRAYANGIKKVRIGGLAGETFDVGSPAVSTPTIQCQDFMSPKECNLLFNVCDPVVCPSSRCDLGGTYAVQDVVQSGIIGSIALCLPNAKEGIKVPVCISGVQAGMDSWISVQESYKECLQQNLDTGETIGICDEVYSIYMCDFFWKQAIPLVKITIPKVLGAVLGQNSRGGGEYLGVADALESAKDSIDYFKSFYAANSWKAFKLRSTEEIGSEVCKSFPSIIYPGSADFLDSLTEPDSPAQFTGRFEESPYTTITNPALSHYKVFYHIYAGKDSGAYYIVSLKQGTGSSYYQDTNLDRRVASGYVNVGGYATDTVDFTAPSGYKLLCITVNGQEECGFESVSTSFAVNYMSDLYIQEQTTMNVKTEKECVSGTASLYSLLNPNIQSSVEELIDPAIYENGIIRICATANPGSGTDASYEDPKYARWVSVGYCGDTNVKCWLDRDKVKEIVKSLNVENSILNETSQNYLNSLFKEGNYLTTEQFKEEVKKINEEVYPQKRIDIIDALWDKIFFNNQKAQLFLIRGQAYANLAVGEYLTIIFKRKALEEKLGETGGSGAITCTGGQTKCENKNYFVCENDVWVDKGLVDGKCEYSASGQVVSCTNGDTKCEGLTYFVCENNIWVNKGLVDGKCRYTISKEEIRYVSPVFIFGAKFLSQNIHLKYDKEWYYCFGDYTHLASPCEESENWHALSEARTITRAVQDAIFDFAEDNLDKKTYDEGLKYLIDKTKQDKRSFAVKEGDINIEMASDGSFVLDKEGNSIDLMWSTQYNDWMWKAHDSKIEDSGMSPWSFTFTPVLQSHLCGYCESSIGSCTPVLKKKIEAECELSKENIQGFEKLLPKLHNLDFYSGAKLMFEFFISGTSLENGGTGTTTTIPPSTNPTEEEGCNNENLGNYILENAIRRTVAGEDTTRIEKGGIVYDNVCATFISNVLIDSGVFPQFDSCSIETTPYRDAIVELIRLFKENDFTKIDEEDWKNNLEAGDLLIWGGTGEYDREYQHITIFEQYDGAGVKIVHDGGKTQKISEKTYTNIYGEGWYLTHVWRAKCSPLTQQTDLIPSPSTPTTSDCDYEKIKPPCTSFENDVEKWKFTEAERKIFSEVKNCEECGEGLFNVCDKEECKAIALKIEKNCRYSSYNCVED